MLAAATRLGRPLGEYLQLCCAKGVRTSAAPVITAKSIAHHPDVVQPVLCHSPAARADNSAKLWGFIEDTPWADGIKLVPVTAEGLALPGFNYQLLQAMTPLRVETWADFSSRLVGVPRRRAALAAGSSAVQCKHAPASTHTCKGRFLNARRTIDSALPAIPPCLQPQAGLPPEQPGPPPSAEGNHQRCFDSMLICTHGLNITRWPLHGFGRHLVQTYKHLLAPEARAAAETESAVRAGRPGPPTAGSLTMLSVVFQKRVGDTRQILNLEELLQRCNKWQHTTADGRRFGFKCWEVSGLAQGLRECANASEATVLQAARMHSQGPPLDKSECFH